MTILLVRCTYLTLIAILSSQIVHIDIPPYPHCTLDDATLEINRAKCDKDKASRNNFNIQAMNYFIEKNLLALNYAGMILIKSFDILVPRATLGETMCTNHYLCEHQQTTPAGIVVLDAIKAAVCLLAQE